MTDDSSIPSFLSLRMPGRKSRKESVRGAKLASTTPPQLAFDLTSLPTSPPELRSEPAKVPEKTSSPLAFEPTQALETTPETNAERKTTAVRYTVRQLINEVRQHVEGAYSGLIYVEGEISNCRPAASGHFYFTLKDGDAQLPVVMFRRQAMLLGFRPKDGLAVEVRGRISVYESRGQLQLIAEALRPRGTGALQLAFEQLRDRLRFEGLFDRPKRPLPPFPHCIGIVTSPHGAAIRDIIQVVRRRHGRLNILIFPAVMQGVQCASSVAAGIRWFNRHPEHVDLILLARGGGSLEDLAGFNDEMLARVIVSSKLPVVSAIGHEIDNTIADYVADLRAPTPSAAAELVTAAQHRIEERVGSLGRRVQRAGEFYMMRARHRFESLSVEHVLARLHDAVGRREQMIDDSCFRMKMAMDRGLRTRIARLVAAEGRLRRHDPTLRLALAQRRLSGASDRIVRLAVEMVRRRYARVERASLRLAALSPLAVLNRGYAIVYLETREDEVRGAGELSSVLTDASMVAPNQRIRARLAHGSIHALITETNS